MTIDSAACLISNAGTMYRGRGGGAARGAARDAANNTGGRGRGRGGRGGRGRGGRGRGGKGGAEKTKDQEMLDVEIDKYMGRQDNSVFRVFLLQALIVESLLRLCLCPPFKICFILTSSCVCRDPNVGKMQKLDAALDDYWGKDESAAT